MENLLQSWFDFLLIKMSQFKPVLVISLDLVYLAACNHLVVPGNVSQLVLLAKYGCLKCRTCVPSCHPKQSKENNRKAVHGADRSREEVDIPRRLSR